MRLKSTVIAVVCGVVALNVAVATMAKSQAKSQPAAVQANHAKVNLYAKPMASAKVVATYKPNHAFVPIFRKGEWLKVGMPKDGTVGWINMKQYRKAYNAWYQPKMQTVFIRSEQDKDGKPVVNVVAYSNGKKLDEKQARALYKRMQKEQRAEMHSMQQFNHQMNHFFERQDAMFEHDFPGFRHSDFIPPVMMRPVIVVTQPAPPAANVAPADQSGLKPALNSGPVLKQTQSKS